MYHSALDIAVSAEPLDRFESGGSVAFVHDVMEGYLPEEYRTCDILYSDLAWQQGFVKFNRRARKEDGRKYREYMAAVSSILEERITPAIMVTGKHARKLLPKAHYEVPVRLNGPEVVAYCYDFLEEPPGGMDAEELIRYMARERHYERIGDFHCGYGRSGRVFQEEGKSWVMSDFNPMCIGVIAKTAQTWG